MESAMAMKSVLVPVYPDPGTSSVLKTACLFAERFKSTIEGISLEFPPTHMLTGDIYGGAWVPSAQGPSERQTREAREAFEAGMRAGGIVPVGANPTGPSWRWSEQAITDAGGMAGWSRVFDITVYGRTTPSVFAAHQYALESTLFESGRPVLLAPPAPGKSIGDTVLIAWNCSTESARTVAHAMPILEQAKRVVVLTVEGGTVPGPAGSDLATRLAANGVKAEARTVPDHARGSGATILAETTKLGADLVIKGAYTQSRLRQLIFGGATSHILAHAELPVFMAH